MTALVNYFRDLYAAAAGGWNRFWFSPRDPATLGIVRILAGCMLFYTHAVWFSDSSNFFGDSSWINPRAMSLLETPALYWSHWWLGSSTPWQALAHSAALIVFALLTFGVWSRVTAPLAALITISYAHRVPAALFGLDQINGFLALYLALGPCGAAFSMDAWRRRRALTQHTAAPAQPSVLANISQRLIQVHLCVIYLSAGLAKLQGASWWDGTAIWLASANLEYQSIDMTWLAHHPWVFNLLTHVTVAWEISYCVLVWPRLSRPLVLSMAVGLHLGIAFCMGMMTFGLAMLIANVAFVPPEMFRRLQFAIVGTRQKTDAANDRPSVLELPVSNSGPARRKSPAAQRAG